MKRRTMIAAALAATVGGAVLWSQMSGSEPTGAATAAETDYADVDTSSISEMTMGPEDAKVTVTEYASFTCPHCATFHATTFQELKRDYIDTDKVRFVYRDVYFDRVGLWASMLARCAGPDRFFGISDLLYSQQKDWLEADDAMTISKNLRRIGKVAGLEEDQINACLEDADKAETLLAWFNQNRDADDINSTPTVVIDGEKHGNPSYSELKAIIDEKLEK